LVSTVLLYECNQITFLAERKKEKIIRVLITRLLLVFCMALISFYVAAQQKDSSRRNQPGDTTKPDLISGLRKLGEKAAQKPRLNSKRNRLPPGRII
jgi:hypothetical protein